MDLGVTSYDETCFVSDQVALCVVFLRKYPAGGNNGFPFQYGDLGPDIFGGKCSKLIVDRPFLVQGFSRIHCLLEV